MDKTANRAGSAEAGDNSGTKSPDSAALTGRLVGDIGGTSARFALLDTAGRLRGERRLAVAEYPDMTMAIAAYLAAQPVVVDRACLAVAGPVTEDRISFTNSDWQFSTAALQRHFQWRDLRVINDFTAQAEAIPYLDPKELRQIGGGRARAEATVAILGPGTGLGVSALVRSAVGSIAVAGEGGHAGLAANDAREDGILRYLRGRFDRVSAERVLSGGGLVALAEAVAAIRGTAPPDLQPGDVVERALAGSDAICVEALQVFCRFLGAVAGDLVLTFGAQGGLYVAGGVVPRFADFLAASDFRAAFEAKGRMRPYLAAVPSYLILAETPALRGAAAVLTASAGD